VNGANIAGTLSAHLAAIRAGQPEVLGGRVHLEDALRSWIARWTALT